MGSCINCGSVINNTEKEINKLQSANYSDICDKIYNFNYAKVIKVYDGDTFTIAAYDNGVLTKFQVRLYGINCEELKDKNYINRQKAYAAKNYIEKTLLNKIINIEILNNKVINGKKIKEKYGRLLANVNIEGINPAAELIKQNLAKEYYGGTK
jgi:endonuclease YncB( thermonuclease family)